jgi:hypothetical protein
MAIGGIFRTAVSYRDGGAFFGLCTSTVRYAAFAEAACGADFCVCTLLNSVVLKIAAADRVLVILSKNSLGSAWVENEAKKAMAEERKKRGVISHASSSGRFDPRHRYALGGKPATKAQHRRLSRLGGSHSL